MCIITPKSQIYMFLLLFWRHHQFTLLWRAVDMSCQLRMRQLQYRSVHNQWPIQSSLFRISAGAKGINILLCHVVTQDKYYPQIKGVMAQWPNPSIRIKMWRLEIICTPFWSACVQWYPLHKKRNISILARDSTRNLQISRRTTKNQQLVVCGGRQWTTVF